jgi:transposase-like protein
MSKPTVRVFAPAFKQAAVKRIEAGERLRAVAEDLGVRRKLLYDWRAAWRAQGIAGFTKKRGRRPKAEPADRIAGPDAELAAASLRYRRTHTPLRPLLAQRAPIPQSRSNEQVFPTDRLRSSGSYTGTRSLLLPGDMPPAQMP